MIVGSEGDGFLGPVWTQSRKILQSGRSGNGLSGDLMGAVVACIRVWPGVFWKKMVLEQFRFVVSGAFVARPWRSFSVVCGE